MDRYAYIVEQLRHDDFHRLRAFTLNGRGKFTTWLTVVVRRLCLDQHRHKYGRAAPDAVPRQAEELAVRRRLVDLVAGEIDVGRLGGSDGDPEQQVEAEELHAALTAALDDLEPRDRLLLALRFEEELAAREISRLLGFPTPFHVYRRLGALLATLRDRLERHGFRDAAP